jgi:transposase InsO family protein
VRLARQKPRYGYRLLHALLNRRGHEVNVKRVYRLYVEEGLTVCRKRRKRLVRDRAAEPRLIEPNQEWAMDFIVDGMATGRISPAIRLCIMTSACCRSTYVPDLAVPMVFEECGRSVPKSRCNESLDK